jgi:TPR repeat protein
MAAFPAEIQGEGEAASTGAGNGDSGIGGRCQGICRLDRLAEHWWLAAAAQGSGEGLLRVGDLAHARGEHKDALSLYEQAVRAPAGGGAGIGGHIAEAAVKLAGMHAKKEGGGKGKEEARRWYTIAKSRGGAGAVAAAAAEAMMDAGGAWERVVGTVKSWFGGRKKQSGGRED